MNSYTLFLPLLVTLPLPLPLPCLLPPCLCPWQLLLLVVFDCSYRSFYYDPIDDNVHILNLFDSSSSCKVYELHLYPFFFYQSKASLAGFYGLEEVLHLYLLPATNQDHCMAK